VKIAYCFTKTGYEAEYWTREIQAASGPAATFVPFNYSRYLNPFRYIRAQLLDELYYRRDPRLFDLYQDFERLVNEVRPDAVVADTCVPFHPDYLRSFRFHKVLRIADGPISAYDRDFAYLHAYDQVLYHSPAYSRDMGMEEKLRYCGARVTDFWSLGLFDAMFNSSSTEHTILAGERDVDIVFVGALHVNKMPLLARVKRAFHGRCRLYGLANLKRNAYFNLRYGMPGWVRPIPAPEYVSLYQRAKIGFNTHNRGKYTVGSYRLFELPANGVMQISDGGDYLESWFRRGEEIVSYETVDELIDRLRYYLEHDEERRAIAVAGYRRVLAEHRMADRMVRLRELIESGMDRSRSARLSDRSDFKTGT
jgi:spore maturation protein CgeB